MTRHLLLTAMAMAAAARAGEWSQPVEVRHDDALCVSYRARLDGGYLVVRVTVGTGWHTFALDNKQRAEEKLAGKPALSMDRATEITAAGLETAGQWFQSPPKDFSHPELRWFSWGFDAPAVFAAKVRRSGAAPVQLKIQGQACTASICKNVDVALAVPPAVVKADAAPAEVNLKDLIPARP